MTNIALVTGANSGIGRATALRLGIEGAGVAVHYLSNRAEAMEVVEELRAMGRDADAFCGDLTDLAQLRTMVSGVERRFGRIDVLVNNAGDLVERRGLLEMTPDLYRKIFDVNVATALFCCQAVAGGMIARRSGAIVNLSSLAAHNGGGPGAYVYAAAKAAIIALTKGLARELAPHGIRVNCVSPGLIGGTAFHARFTPPEAFASAEKTVPLGRAGTPDDVARVIAFLAGTGAGYVAGETIEINGGMMMR